MDYKAKVKAIKKYLKNSKFKELDLYCKTNNILLEVGFHNDYIVLLCLEKDQYKIYRFLKYLKAVDNEGFYMYPCLDKESIDMVKWKK